MAQLDSASDSDSEGQQFESVRVGQKIRQVSTCRIFLSIAKVMVYHHRRCISSAVGCIFFRNDDIQCIALMIYRNKLRMIYTPFGVIWTRQFKPKQKLTKTSFLSPLHRKSTCKRRCFFSFLLRIKTHNYPFMPNKMNIKMYCLSKTAVFVLQI